MTETLRGQAAIVGVATAGTGEAPGRTSIELLGEAAIAALGDAGIPLGDVDGVFAATGVHGLPAISTIEYLGLKPRYIEGTNVGGSSFEIHLMQAAVALQARLCDVRWSPTGRTSARPAAVWSP
jgi:acetyl-CoA acetyltransferase